jgi:hypothetical protein
MDVKEMLAKHARSCARIARGERTVEDVLGNDDFCLMRVRVGAYACFDCELIVFLDKDWPDRVNVTMLEMTDDQVEKVRQVLQNSGKWDRVHVLDGTMVELHLALDDYAAIKELRPLLTPEDRQAWLDISEAAYCDRRACEPRTTPPTGAPD